MNALLQCFYMNADRFLCKVIWNAQIILFKKN